MSRLSSRKLILPGVTFLAFWTLAVVGWRLSGFVQPLLLFGYIGTALGVGLGLYATLPRKKKQRGRKLTLLLVGGLLLIFVGGIQQENIQIEWMFFSVLAGLSGAALIHYLIAKIAGPLLFGRLWCGWACWTLMVLDLLPFQRSPGRVAGRWDRLRYLHFGLSLGLVLVLWFGFRYRDQVHFGSATGFKWMVVGNVLYYATAVVLAYALRDNRAFCKYVCPIPVLQTVPSRLSLLKIAVEGDKCDECEACVKMCPMDIELLDYIKNGERILSTECMLCQTCITVCPRDALKVSFGFDLGGEGHLREQPSSRDTA